MKIAKLLFIILAMLLMANEFSFAKSNSDKKTAASETAEAVIIKTNSITNVENIKHPSNLYVTEQGYATWESPAETETIYYDDFESYNAGEYLAVQAGNLSSGVYFYRIQAGAFLQVKKMLLIR